MYRMTCSVQDDMRRIQANNVSIVPFVIQSLEAVRSATTYCVLAKDLWFVHDEILRKLRMTCSVQDDM